MQWSKHHQSTLSSFLLSLKGCHFKVTWSPCHSLAISAPGSCLSLHPYSQHYPWWRQNLDGWAHQLSDLQFFELLSNMLFLQSISFIPLWWPYPGFIIKNSISSQIPASSIFLPEQQLLSHLLISDHMEPSSTLFILFLPYPLLPH